MPNRVYTIAVEPLSLTISRVHLDGEKIGTVEHFTTARRPKVWFAVDADGNLIQELAGHIDDTSAAFALARHVSGQQLAQRIVEKLEGRDPTVEEAFGEPLYSVRVKGDTAEAETVGAAFLALHTLAKENGE